jgi:acyl-CoA synthetase (AMP-forming)/AMP-acid ligase II
MQPTMTAEPHVLIPALEQNGESEGIIDGDYRSSWKEHSDRVARLSDALKNQLGVSSDDRFAVLALNSHNYLELWHAAFMGAGVINPLNLRLAPKELAYIIQDSGTEVIFTDGLFGGLVEQARREMGGNDPIRKVVLIGEGDVAHDVGYEALLDAASATMPAEPEETDPVVLMYTGGTTGLPKGVLIQHRAEVLNLYHGAMTLSGLQGGTYLMQTPMFHAASMFGILGTPVFANVSPLSNVSSTARRPCPRRSWTAYRRNFRISISSRATG